MGQETGIEIGLRIINGIIVYRKWYKKWYKIEEVGQQVSLNSLIGISSKVGFWRETRSPLLDVSNNSVVAPKRESASFRC